MKKTVWDISINLVLYRVYQNDWSGFEIDYDTHLQMFTVCTLRHTAHIEAIVQFLPYSAQQVRCDGLHSHGNYVLQIRYAHGLWWHKHFVLHVTPKEVVTRG